ncbi:hypothetical protein TWF281_009776 [Arthrobotrys megalospora]
MKPGTCSDAKGPAVERWKGPNVKTPILKLAPEILLMICEYLPRSTLFALYRTCKRLKQVSGTLLYKRLDIPISTSGFEAPVIESLLQPNHSGFPEVRDLYFVLKGQFDDNKAASPVYTPEEIVLHTKIRATTDMLLRILLQHFQPDQLVSFG